MGRILVTGATGFVGSQLVETLLAQGRELTIVTRSSSSCPPAWRSNAKLRIMDTGPIEAATGLEHALVGVSAVVHSAGLAHLPRSKRGGNDEPYFAANAAATERLTRAAVNSDVKTFVHLSSLAAITPNESTTVVDDNSYHDPTTPYGWSKRAAENHVSELVSKGIFAISLRPALIVGAQAKGNWGSLQRLAATGLPLPFASVGNRRALISINSIVQVLSHLALRPWSASLSGNYCIADAERLSLPEILSELRVGMRRPRRLFDFPLAMMQGAARIGGRPELASGLLGNLDVDASRFGERFAYEQSYRLGDAIRVSGREYVGQSRFPDTEAIST